MIGIQFVCRGLGTVKGVVDLQPRKGNPQSQPNMGDSARFVPILAISSSPTLFSSLNLSTANIPGYIFFGESTTTTPSMQILANAVRKRDTTNKGTRRQVNHSALDRSPTSFPKGHSGIYDAFNARVHRDIGRQQRWAR